MRLLESLALRLLRWGPLVVPLGLVLEARHPFSAMVVLALVVASFGGGRRALLALLSITLFWAAFPPLQLPTYVCCLFPLVVLWRDGVPRWHWSLESFAFGFATCWVSAPFLRDMCLNAGGILLGLFGVAFGVQFVGIAWGLRACRRWSMPLAALVSAVIATFCEWARARLLMWPTLVLATPAAETPLAQWAAVGGIFGVSFLLYLINFLWWPSTLKNASRRRWLNPLASSCFLGTALASGMLLADRTQVPPFPLSLLLVQPSFSSNSQQVRPNYSVDDLDRLTRGSSVRPPDHDLIVWPETILSLSNFNLAGPDKSGTLGDFFRNYMNDYQSNCLVGVAIRGEIPGRDFNSACIVTRSGDLSRHDKLYPVPLTEYMPEWLDDDWMRNVFNPALGFHPNFRCGEAYQTLAFRNRRGESLRLGIAICYESLLPWLPQYQPENRADVIFHLTNLGWFFRYPEAGQHALWSVQYRAIETRTWQVICSDQANSGTIDPTGRIRMRLGREAGTLSVPDR